jgi:hypothetical protein
MKPKLRLYLFHLGVINLKMDKSQKKVLKNKFREEKREHEVASQLWAIREGQIRQVSRIDKTILEQWTDQQLERKIIDYVFNQFSQAGKRPTHQNVQEWERSILLQLPLGIQTVFATYLFESDLSLNGSFWDFFYQNNGAFTLETLKGYQLMQNEEMITILQQCIGAYLKMKRTGEIVEAMGAPHHWELDEDYYISINQESFDELDVKYQLEEKEFLNKLIKKKQAFIRSNIELFETKN